MKELISVIIPVYNVEAYLNRCMESVVKQTYRSLEIILVDDGATDLSGQMCDKWAVKDDRIKVIHKHNGGLSSARNIGLDIILGKYVMFVDSDDILSENLVSALYEELKENETDLSICDPLHIFDDTTPKFEKLGETRVLDPVTAIQEMWYQRSFLASAWGKLYKSELFDDVRFTVGRFYEDVDIMHEIFWKCKRIAYSNARLYGYVHRGESITTQKFSKKDLDIFVISDKILKFAFDRDAKLIPAAESYATGVALRIFLNAPNSGYENAVNQAEQTINRYGHKVLKDSNIRIKQKCALIMFFYCRPLMKIVYKHINRWK